MQRPRAIPTSRHAPDPTNDGSNPLQLLLNDNSYGEAREAVGLGEELLAWPSWQPMWLSPWHLDVEVFRFGSPGKVKALGNEGDGT